MSTESWELHLQIALCAAVVAGGALLSAQESGLPSQPIGQFGGSVTGAYDGWFENTDGSRSFLVGYFSRNAVQSLDIPIGPDNRIEPGGPDLGQPTHFLPGRHAGMFTVRVPDDFAPGQTLWWTLTANGQTTRIPLRTRTAYFVSPFGGDVNRPPTIRFLDGGPSIAGPVATPHTAVAREASVNTPVPLSLRADDDARYTSGTNALPRNPPPPVSMVWTKYRGPGPVVFDDARPALTVDAGGSVGQPFSGTASTTASFPVPGEYLLHAQVNDYSGAGGNGEVCCWTTALVRLNVTPGPSRR